MIYFIWRGKRAAKNTRRKAHYKNFFKRTCDFVLRYSQYDRAAGYLFAGIFISLISFLIFYNIAEGYFESGNWGIDRSAWNFANSIRSTSLNSILKFITSTGNFFSVLFITLALMSISIYKRMMVEGMFFGGNVLGVWIFNEILKSIFRRTRPSEMRIVEASGYSFPSGHAMIFMGLSLMMIYFSLRYIKNRKLACAASLIIFVYAVIVGLSRVYLGVHYMSDVIAGWIAAVLWVLTVIAAYRVFQFFIILSDGRYSIRSALLKLEEEDKKD
ncbi:phosphatase PAP2 family protein [Fonticella tunisiensis]|nr:phosphatase PAP2 family protein [Fonticella tunisiensis]